MGAHAAMFHSLVSDENGQDMVEYIFIAGLIGLATIVSMSSLSGKIATLFSTVGNTVTNAA